MNVYECIAFEKMQIDAKKEMEIEWALSSLRMRTFQIPTIEDITDIEKEIHAVYKEINDKYAPIYKESRDRLMREWEISQNNYIEHLVNIAKIEEESKKVDNTKDKSFLSWLKTLIS